MQTITILMHSSVNIELLSNVDVGKFQEKTHHKFCLGRVAGRKKASDVFQSRTDHLVGGR